MPIPTIQPDLIIALSRDEIRLNLSANPSLGRQSWQTAFRIESMFLQDQISTSIDFALMENPSLFDPLSCVEIVIVDRPNICVPKIYADEQKLNEIASRYLRVRAGDTLTTDITVNDKVICYSVPTDTLSMLREYYANVECHHLCSILWHHFSNEHSRPEPNKTRLYLTLTGETLIVIAEKNNELIFSKNFIIKEQNDLYYFSVACSRMLNADENWLVTLNGESSKIEMRGDSIIKMAKHLTLPSLHVLMSQYKVCAS